MHDSFLSENIQFVQMSAEMLPLILVIENQSYPVSWSEQIFKDCIKSNYLCQVLKIDGTIVGYYVVQNIIDEYHILNICVAPDFLTKGLGRLLLNAILKRAEAAAMNRILLEVRASNKVARKLYVSSGFHIIGKRKGYYPISEGREDAHVMELALP